MTRTTKPQRIRHHTAVSGPQCVHCGVDTIVAELGLVQRLQREHPLPGLNDVIVQVLLFHKPSDLVAVCPRCVSITVDVN